jgi:hypothetical protein
MTAKVVEAGIKENKANLELTLTLQTTADNFKYKGHAVKYFAAKTVAMDQPVPISWVSFNGRELKSTEFSRLNSSGCFYSELFPFSEQCTARNLAT